MTERFVGDTGYMVLLINELRITNASFMYLHNLTSTFLSDEVSNWWYLNTDGLTYKYLLRYFCRKTLKHGQIQTKWNSSSISLLLQQTQYLSLRGILLRPYLPVWILSEWTEILNLTNWIRKLLGNKSK